MNSAYRLSLWCGGLPLAIGTAIFALWLVTGWFWLMIAGIFALYGGPVLVSIGFAALGRYWWLVRRDMEASRERGWLRCFLAAALLLSNFAAAAGIVTAVVLIETRFSVVVKNSSGQTLEGVRVVGGGCVERFGTISPGGTARRSFWIRRDGELVLQAMRGTTEISESIEGYVTPNMGGRLVATVNPDGRVAVFDATVEP